MKQDEKIFYKAGFKYQLSRSYYGVVPIYPKEDISTDFIFLNQKGYLYIRHGYAWDGASGPTIDTKSSMRASLEHDALYQLLRLGLLDHSWRGPIDKHLEKRCCGDGMFWLRAGIWERTVRWFAASSSLPSSERPELSAP